MTTFHLEKDEVQIPVPFTSGHNRIVSAANRLPDGTIVMGIRHFDEVMAKQLRILQPEGKLLCEQGFVDRFGEYHDRKTAWKIAYSAGQIIRRTHGDDKDGGTLYSENLY